MTDMHAELLEAIPDRLRRLLERHLLAVEIDVFWDRKDALGCLLPSYSADPQALADARVQAVGKVPDELLTAVLENIDGPDSVAYTLDELLDDWERLRVDHEKLVGHLLRTHREPLEPTLAREYLAAEEHHRELHAEAVVEDFRSGT